MTDPRCAIARGVTRCGAYGKNDLAAKNPDEFTRTQALFKTEAESYRVLPRSNSSFVGLLKPRPSAVAGKTAFTFSGENVNSSWGPSHRAYRKTIPRPTESSMNRV